MTPLMRRGLTASLGTAAVVALALPAAAQLVPSPLTDSSDDARIALRPLGAYDSGIIDTESSAAEIVVHHARSQRWFVVNAKQAVVDVLDGADPAHPRRLFGISTVGTRADDGSTVPAGAVANSVAVRKDGLLAVAVESVPKTQRGWVVFLDAAGDGTPLGAVRVGAQPDMVTFTPDGTRVVTADEGEPDPAYAVDPEGSISVIDVPRRVAAPGQSDVRTADFRAFDAPGALPDGVRVFGRTVTPARRVSENLEPEYVAVDHRSRTAYVSVQEANAVAIVDLATARVERLVPLGAIDRGVVPFDGSDRDGINIRTWPGVRSLRQPDGIAAYTAAGDTYLVTANEGDSRDWSGYSEVTRLSGLASQLCAEVAPLAASSALGRLNVTRADGFDPARGCYSQVVTFGGRGLSVLDDRGRVVFDSGADLEQRLARIAPGAFNANHSSNDADNRSDDKGPEPEGVTVGKVGGRTYAFLGLERIGGVVVYDVTRPTAVRYVTYLNNRSLAAMPTLSAAAGDLGPEGVHFVPASDSPTGEPMLGVANEVSGTVTLYAVDDLLD